jgi:hypothetical protein
MKQTVRPGLGPIDRIVLVGIWVASCGLVYGLGFYTGSHTLDRMPSDEERIVRLPVAASPPPAGQRAKGSDDLTFWTALESGGQRSKPGDEIPDSRTTAPAAAAPAAKPESGARTKSSRPTKSKSTARSKSRASSPTPRKTAAAAPATKAAGVKAAAPASRGTVPAKRRARQTVEPKAPTRPTPAAAARAPRKTKAVAGEARPARHPSGERAARTRSVVAAE